MRVAALVSALCAVAGTAFAQNVLPINAPVTVTNTAAHPVPVVGTVKLDGGVGAVTGTMKSGDKNVTVHSAFITVDTPNFGNHGTGQLDVSDYKEVRVSFMDGSCGPCGSIVAAVLAVSDNGHLYQIDQFPVNQEGAGVSRWATRTYTVPGSKLTIALRSMSSGTTNSVLVTVIGRAN